MENDKTISDLINELETNEKLIEKALKKFRGHKAVINTVMLSSVNSGMIINKLDWSYLVGLNEQHYILISEEPFETYTGNNLIFDLDNIYRAELNEKNLEIWFGDGLHLSVKI